MRFWSLSKAKFKAKNEREMFLDRLNNEEDTGGNSAGRPLVVTRDSPRKAFFKKLNRHGHKSSGSKKVKRRNGIYRGNSFAGMASSQRVVVKINPVKKKTKGVGTGAGSGGQNLYHHIHYISRKKAGQDGEQAILFDGENEGLTRQDFFELCKNDRHHFRMIISPERGEDIEHFQGYVRKVMSRVERDLKVKLNWVGAVHYDTDDTHAHVIIKGKDERGEDLVIGRDYIAFGIRARAQEIATELLGERSLDDIQRSIEKEVDALRVTSLDKFIERHANEERIIDVRKANNFDKSAHYEASLKGRLRYLETAGLAREEPPGVYTLNEDYQDVLYKIATRNDVIKQLYGRLDEPLDDLQVYSLKSGEGVTVEGRVLDKGPADELTDKKYLVVEALGGGMHYVPVGEPFSYEKLEKGALIRVRPFDQSSGRADYNINLIARQNDGIYDIEKHRQYIEKEQNYIDEDAREGYLASHIKRIETLEQNDAATDIGQGRFKVPVDVVERGKEISAKINAREKKRFYPKLDILSHHAPEDLTDATKKTWLDRELYARSRSKSGVEHTDAALEKALEKRQEWLVKNNLALIQSNGEFALRKSALRDLTVMEVHKEGQFLATKAGLEFNAQKVSSSQEFTYLGHTELESGKWAVVMRGKELQMARLDKAPETQKGQKIVFDEIDRGTFHMKASEQAKKQEQARANDKDQEREL